MIYIFIQPPNIIVIKIIPLLLFASFITTISEAQVKLGAKAGINLSNLTLSETPVGFSLSSKTGFNGRVMALIPLFTPFYLQPEILYSGLGATTNVLGSHGKLNYNCFNIPILFKYQD